MCSPTACGYSSSQTGARLSSCRCSVSRGQCGRAQRRYGPCARARAHDVQRHAKFRRRIRKADFPGGRALQRVTSRDYTGYFQTSRRSARGRTPPRSRPHVEVILDKAESRGDQVVMEERRWRYDDHRARSRRKVDGHSAHSASYQPVIGWMSDLEALRSRRARFPRALVCAQQRHPLVVGGRDRSRFSRSRSRNSAGAREAGAGRDRSRTRPKWGFADSS